ncbi:MAG: 2-C-methyl-D-erythritol 2,4-cyclodiphosphate synthase [Mariprofundaceae bacterium]|nr:2-C-methyl-D-erythritol 2,4-cyclodiphosphate synthase [Mariprofundaceae bacterium]
MTVRIGQGFDVHAFAEHRKLMLGGIEVHYHLGLAGHSDADVLIHAVCDALLGAAGLGDIGHHFPDSDPQYQGIDSRKLLSHVMKTLHDLGWKVGNLDATVIAQQPKLATYIPDMRACLASLLVLDVAACNVKATTTEKLGFTGRGEGIAAQAVVLLVADFD